jgi:hypothetical protein
MLGFSLEHYLKVMDGMVKLARLWNGLDEGSFSPARRRAF